jgi:hypothetical protein
VVKLLIPGAVIAVALLAVAQPAFAQASTTIQYSDPDSDRRDQRVLHYQTGPLEADREADTKPATEAATAASAAETGAFAPYSLSAQVAPGRSWLSAVGGYDTSVQDYRARSSAESSVTRYLALRVDYEHGASTTTMDRVSLGARLQLLNQKAHGIDLGTGLFYQPHDFRGEGNVVGGLMLGRRFGRVAVFGSALVGSDPEGDDQELDGRLGTLIRVNQTLQLGWDDRYRCVLSTDNKRIGTSTVDWELALLPNAVLTLGPMAVIGEAGFSALQQADFVGQPDQRRNLRTGLLAMAGAGAAF